VRFWETSAVVPLLVTEATTPAAAREQERDPELLVWWATRVECASALTRRDREGKFEDGGLSEALARLGQVQRSWTEVQPVERVRDEAARLLRVHALRAADAMQLAAAIVAAEGQPATLSFLTLDRQLAVAAEREGLPIVRLDEGPGES